MYDCIYFTGAMLKNGHFFNFSVEELETQERTGSFLTSSSSGTSRVQSMAPEGEQVAKADLFTEQKLQTCWKYSLQHRRKTFK